MNSLRHAVWAELLKVRRSKVPVVSLLAFSLAPLAGAFFMVILKDPALARRMGMISAKAQIVAGSADWPTFLEVLAQANGIGGIILFSFVATWVFGRELVDRTITDLLALPTPRSAIVAAKFIVVGGWCALLMVLVYVLGLTAGAVIGLPDASAAVFWEGTITFLAAGVLAVVLAAPIAFFASAGRGYLVPLGTAVFLLVLAQLVTAAGWGEFFPWAVPALRAGLAGAQGASLDFFSYALVAGTSLAGMVATFVWWEYADQAG
jgi:ABC-2 type transport system permease protein